VIEGFRVRVGDLREYDLLARFHYRAGRPATVTRVLVLERRWRGPLADASASAGEHGAEPIGVLVVSIPTLNGRWRELAWPGRYRTGDRRRDAARVNRELRTISRVIIDPRFRGLGLGAELVRAYLRWPLTPGTEAVAAMGRCCPFFAAAGMTAYQLGRSVSEARLERALRACGMSPVDLLHSPALRARLTSGTSRPGMALLRLELRRWANSGRATRHLLDEAPAKLARAAGMALLARPIAYAHGARELTPETPQSTPMSQAPLTAREGPRGTDELVRRRELL
jgi:hypothetical protein